MRRSAGDARDPRTLDAVDGGRLAVDGGRGVALLPVVVVAPCEHLIKKRKMESEFPAALRTRSHDRARNLGVSVTSRHTVGCEITLLNIAEPVSATAFWTRSGQKSERDFHHLGFCERKVKTYYS